MFVVYKHTSPSGKAYVGVTGQPGNRRWRSHVSVAQQGCLTAFHRAIRKYGPEAFTHEVLERVTTEAGAKRAEQLWIRELDTARIGYNLTTGGDGRSGPRGPLSAVHKARIAAAHVGLLPTAETTARMSAAQKRAHSSDPSRRTAIAVIGARAKSEVTKARMSVAQKARAARQTPAERSRIAAIGGRACAGKAKVRRGRG